MTRIYLTEQGRRLRAEEKRDPITHAVYALAALSDRDLTSAAERFNAIFAEGVNAKSISVSLPNHPQVPG
jgi:hypothetical protein